MFLRVLEAHGFFPAYDSVQLFQPLARSSPKQRKLLFCQLFSIPSTRTRAVCSLPLPTMADGAIEGL